MNDACRRYDPLLQAFKAAVMPTSGDPGREMLLLSLRPSQNTLTPSSIFTPARMKGSSRNFGES